MKKIKKINIYMIVACLFFTTACEDYLDINENPNNPEEASAPSLLINSTYETAQNTFRLGDFTSYYVQYLASPNPGSSSDVMDPVSHSITWENLYNVMTDLTDLMDKAEETESIPYRGVAKILMALNLGMTIDAWGNIPYSEAFRFTTLTPSYDSDQELYEEIFRLLDEGIQDLSAETILSIGSDDFIYGGSLEQWEKFANMLRARYLNHLSETPEYDPAAILQAIDNGFTGNDDDAQVDFFEDQFNPWALIVTDNENLILGGWISQQFIQSLDGTTFGVFDPRLPLMVDTTDSGTFLGTVNGAGRGDAPASGARSTLISDGFYTADQAPVLIATYAEQQFIEAEAAFTIDKTRAYEAYLEGIRAHMDKIGVDTVEIEKYINNPVVSMGVDAFTIDDVFKEKYVAMFLHPEAWVDARRHDYQYEDMTLPENLNPDLNNEFIRRLVYPDSEISRNGANVPEVTLLDRIWWDN